MVREHMAQLWSRWRNRKRMDYAKGRAMIGKFEMGQIVPTSGAPTNESAASSPEMTIQEIVSCGHARPWTSRRAGYCGDRTIGPVSAWGPFPFTTVSLALSQFPPLSTSVGQPA